MVTVCWKPDHRHISHMYFEPTCLKLSPLIRPPSLPYSPLHRITSTPFPSFNRPVTVTFLSHPYLSCAKQSAMPTTITLKPETDKQLGLMQTVLWLADL